jgi:hypothetical protein
MSRWTHTVPVSVGQCVSHLAHDSHRVGHRKLPLALDPSAERFPLDERHGVVQEAVGLARCEQRHDMGMLERGSQLDFATKAIGTDRRRELMRQYLDDDTAPEREIFRLEHPAHTATGKLVRDAVHRSDGGAELLEQIRRRRSAKRGCCKLGRVRKWG